MQYVKNKPAEMWNQDRRIGQCLAVGLKPETMAVHVGMPESTIHTRIKANTDFINTVRAEVETILALQTSRTVVQVKESAEKQLKAFFDRSFQLSLKAMKKAEEMGDKVTLSELIEIHKNFTVWAAKFAASEAPKRVEMRGSVSHDHEHSISDETFDRFEQLATKMGMAKRELPIIDIPS